MTHTFGIPQSKGGQRSQLKFIPLADQLITLHLSRVATQLLSRIFHITLLCEESDVKDVETAVITLPLDESGTLRPSTPLRSRCAATMAVSSAHTRVVPPGCVISKAGRRHGWRRGLNQPGRSGQSAGALASMASGGTKSSVQTVACGSLMHSRESRI